MFWLHCGLFVLVIAVPGFINTADSTSKREADYTLDDSFWNVEISEAEGEAERLLREYTQNQELLRKIGTHYYQIIYPVQLRHHEKMGISTREVGMSKFPQRGYGESGYQNLRGKTRTGRHFHRTSLLIKAFNHKFRLDLELNGQLLAPNLKQKDFLVGDAEQISKQGIEHCYYHGTIKDYPGASAAFHTCNGLSGVIHLGNETFVVHPFYGGDLSQKHPHVIFEARSKANKGCANTKKIDWRSKNRRGKHVLGLSETTSDRYKRDIREAIKYIETAIIIDKAMFEKRNGSTRAEVVHDAIQVVNIADLYFRTLNTRVSVTYIETWQEKNKANIVENMEIGTALKIFNDYTTRHLYDVSKDTTQLLTGKSFSNDESGDATSSTICKKESVGISVDVNSYELHLLAGTMAHMIGHNIGMNHDDGRNDCVCGDWHGCIMAQSIVGLDNVQPYKFSDCSRQDYTMALQSADALCLNNKPNQVDSNRYCGNRVVDDGEQCDCGPIDECKDFDPCCDPITCNLIREAECAAGPCCNKCKLVPSGVVCRKATNECDLPEVCTGKSGQCPEDVFKKNGSPCSDNTGFCFNGVCPALDLQCEQIWGYGGIAADKHCYEYYNSKGSLNGHCGTDSSGHYIKCEPKNVHCGSLHCQQGKKQPVISGMDHVRIIISRQSKEYECKLYRMTNGKVDGSEVPSMGLVRDGTSCGNNSVCVNQTCTSHFPLIGKETCPSNHNNNECSGKGVCTNINTCYCERGWGGPDCSIQEEIPTLPPTVTVNGPVGKSNTSGKMGPKETPYENYHGSNTVYLVLVLMSVVGGVFVVFTLMALCYREHKPMRTPGINEDEGGTGGEDVVSFIDLQMNKPRKKGILKTQPGYEGGAVVNLERTLDRLNGYHENIMEALRNAKTRQELSGTSTASGNLVTDQISRKTLSECEYPTPCHNDMDGHDDSGNQDGDDGRGEGSCSILRIRNLEDLIKQLERHSSRQINLSPCGSEEMRISESEADRHYRIDSSVCSESSQGSRRCSRARDDTYGRCRQPSSRSPYGTHQHSQHSHQMQVEEGIYETADPDRGSNARGETPDSESDAFIQAQQQLARWTSEDGVQHRPPQQPPPPLPPAMTGGGTMQLLQPLHGQCEHHQQLQHQQRHHHHHHAQPLQPQQQPQQSSLQHQHQLPVEQLPIQQRGYYPSPPHTDNNGLDNDETENAQSHQQQKLLPDVRGIDVNHLPNINKCPLDDTFSLDCNINNGSPKELNTNNTSDNENTALLPPSHFPEYKH
ncbi:disintegrin and metalloproteinase domain-containing protein mind-meld isoform X8 [Megalopta genalis]|uniref:disintegrin and metalloproteinase domain-containing protein mind-meld isoform X8 n=1 Tax=Megalopta genalis TaxID=115081 RepID=UPI003FD04E2D